MITEEGTVITVCLKTLAVHCGYLVVFGMIVSPSEYLFPSGRVCLVYPFSNQSTGTQ